MNQAYYFCSVTGTGESCDNGNGVCIDVNSESCTGSLKTGYCSGPENIMCCETYIGQSCDNGKGTCIDVNTDSCDGLVKSGYCPGSSSIMCCEPGAVVPNRCFGAGPALLNSSYEFTLQNQGFSGHPGALVYVPSTFKSDSIGIEVIVYIHGYNNCIRNIVREKDQGCNCSAGADVRVSYDLIGQFERAALTVEATNWIFVAAEVAYDLASDNPGRWAESGVFRAYLDELFSVHMKPYIGFYSVDNISRARIYSHSGGYYTIGNMAAVGGVEQVYELSLLDSLYADFEHFDDFVKDNIMQFGTKSSEFRFSSIFTLNGGTYNNNIGMENRAKTWVSDAGREEILLIDNTYNPLSISSIASYSLIFKFTNYTHDDICRNMFYDLLVGAV